MAGLLAILEPEESDAWASSRWKIALMWSRFRGFVAIATWWCSNSGELRQVRLFARHLTPLYRNKVGDLVKEDEINLVYSRIQAVCHGQQTTCHYFLDLQVMSISF